MTGKNAEKKIICRLPLSFHKIEDILTFQNIPRKARDSSFRKGEITSYSKLYTMNTFNFLISPQRGEKLVSLALVTGLRCGVEKNLSCFVYFSKCSKMLARLTVIISQCVQILNHSVVHLKLVCYFSIVPQKSFDFKKR